MGLNGKNMTKLEMKKLRVTKCPRIYQKLENGDIKDTNG